MSKIRKIVALVATVVLGLGMLLGVASPASAGTITGVYNSTRSNDWILVASKSSGKGSHEAVDPGHYSGHTSRHVKGKSVQQKRGCRMIIGVVPFAAPKKTRWINVNVPFGPWVQVACKKPGAGSWSVKPNATTQPKAVTQRQYKLGA